MKGTKVSIRLHGGDVSPKTVDPLVLLQLAQASLRLTMKVAEEGGLGLSFRGLSIEGGSAAVASIPSDAGSARVAVGRALRIVRGDEGVPRGMEGAVEELRAQLRAIHGPTSASFHVGAWTKPLKAPPLEKADDGPWERTELRVRPVRIGGTGPEPTARLISESESTPFVVAVSEDDARALGACLYQDVDVELEMCRTADGQIERGRVLKVTRLSDAEPMSAWRSWFSKNAGDWESVEDVGEALGRHH